MPHRPTRPVRPYPSSSDPTDEEILAPIAGLFQNSHDARRTARDLLEVFGGIDGLRRASMRELTSVDGIGPATAACIHAAFLLGRRSLEVVRERLGPYRGARDVFEYLQPEVNGLEKEHFYAMLLDSKNRLLREDLVSVGTLTASLVHPREVFRSAIRDAAASIIVAHNHPSGDPTPSAEDLEITARLRKAGELIGIPLLDHVIIGAGTYVSLAERGKLRGGS
ncbi:MAG: DNA repair protein RadC [Planctomycetota bacterium]|nr:DNA repair protein RadC [Planctomycetota bacterium]